MSAEAGSRRRWPALTIRARITIGAAFVITAVLIGVSVALVRLETDAATRQLDEILSDEAEAIGAAISGGREIPILFDDDRVMVAFDADEGVVASDGAFDELARLEIVTRDDVGVNRYFAGENHRIVAEHYTDADGHTGTVRLAEPLDELGESVASLIRALFWLVPITIIVLLVIIWAVVGRALRPVERMRAEVDAVAFDQLDHRLEVPPGDDEISRLAVTMNTMLARLAVASRRQQRFVADASHELRTPLARMRAELEADERGPEGIDRTATRRSQLEEIAELQQLVDDLLVLARRDAGGPRPAFQTVDLDDIVLEEIATERGDRISIDASGVSGAQVSGVPGDLRRAVRNLLENAIRHARSAVAVSLDETVGGVFLHVDDDGDGVPYHRRLDVFERFVRLDDARSGRTGQTGLGLAIARDVVVRHGGTVNVDDSPLGGARFTVRLPR